jgi:hypothetical protein
MTPGAGGQTQTDAHREAQPTVWASATAGVAHVETCGVHFPRRMFDAYAFEQPAASMIRVA